MKKLGLLFALCTLVGCATLDTSTQDWIAIGPEFSPTKPQDVEVLASAREITQPYGNIGLLRIKNLKPDPQVLKMGVERGKKVAASKGADAILLGQYNSASDGAQDPRVTLIIYAIKYMDTVNEQDIKAMEDFEVMGILNERTQD
ncbi:MAG: hypothetical protein J6Y25_00315 [Elusimicrobiaceae bacterium]|nr:hypothetical protein [Elusimicrobiaceae bacterium]MBP5616821.1 hypothetical protein [Elusimicrobiaceae bacterium]